MPRCRLVIGRHRAREAAMQPQAAPAPRDRGRPGPEPPSGAPPSTGPTDTGSSRPSAQAAASRLAGRSAGSAPRSLLGWVLALQRCCGGLAGLWRGLARGLLEAQRFGEWGVGLPAVDAPSRVHREARRVAPCQAHRGRPGVSDHCPTPTEVRASEHQTRPLMWRLTLRSRLTASVSPRSRGPQRCSHRANHAPAWLLTRSTRRIQAR